MPADLGRYVGVHGAAGRLVVQPRMGMADPEAMATFLCDRKAMPESTAQRLTPEILERAREQSAVRSPQLEEVPSSKFQAPKLKAEGRCSVVWIRGGGVGFLREGWSERI